MAYRQIITAVLAITCILCCMASTPTMNDRQISRQLQSNKIVFIDGKPADSITQHYIDSLRAEISVFYYDQFRHFQDPGAPYFLFMSKDSKLAMGIGGAVRMRAYYDWGGAMPASGFVPYLIPMHPDPADMRHIGTSPSGTCLFFRVLGRNKTLGNYQLYIEGNFNGYEGRDLKLKMAYAIVNDFTVGYAPSTFSDPAALPPTVDAQGPNNKITPTSVLVRYMPVIKNRWVLAASVEAPEPLIGADNSLTKKCRSYMPDFAAFAQYQWAPNQHIRLAGIVRTLTYRDLVAEKTRDAVGWGLQLSSMANPCPELTTFVTANYGAGHSGLGGDLLIGTYDLVPNPEAPGKLYAPRSMGWCLGLKYNIKPELFVSVTASQSRYLPSRAIAPDEYKYGLFGCVNVFWNLTPRIMVAAELDLGKRQNFSGEHRYARRASALCMFSF